MRFSKPLAIFLYAVFLVLLLEIWARGYYSARRGVEFLASPRELIYLWYPELKQAEKDTGKNGPRVLFLGGSVLTEDWGEIPQKFTDEYRKATGQEVNIINLAASAHSSLDSFYKYKWLGGREFDLVVFYHGINEVRANNIPKDLWKKDYSHYSWYDELNFYFRHPALRKTGMLLPYFVKHLLVNFDRKLLNRDRYVPEHSPREEWLSFGSEIKTAESFRENLEGVINMAGRKGEPLMVMTYAYCQPSDEDLADNENPYVAFTEVWGDMDNVIKGMDTHNEIIRRIEPREDLIFVDQEEELGNNRDYFADICHMTGKGSQVFAENMVDALREKVDVTRNGERR